MVECTKEAYLIQHYFDDIGIILNDTNDRTHAALQVDLSQLQQHNFDWFQAILNNVHDELLKWNGALFAAQMTIASKDEGFLEIGFQIKTICHVRFVHFPPPDRRYVLPFPNNDQVGMFRDVKGTVLRMSQVRLLETKREFICSKCHDTIVIEASYIMMYKFEVPKTCSKTECRGSMHQKHMEPQPKYCVNYQELKIQASNSEKIIPPTIVVTLESDLVDSCQPGDCVTICGTVERRWISFQYEGRCQAVVAMRAVSLIREQNHLTFDYNGLSEQMLTITAEWAEQLSIHGELGMRDIILRSFSPSIYGLYPIKLATLLAICSCNETGDYKAGDGIHQRGQSHLLMIGDPGMAKSKLLLSATEVAPRAVHTTGMGCSSAGLTAAAVKEDGEWMLEAGALVLADSGICCIDEFNLMRESDRASIHEAMEQQTISMAKAGIVCKLNTRCAILAAANPKNLHSMSEAEGTSSVNIGIATPLLSRFDLVFIMRDERIPEWDEAIANHLLAQVTTGFDGFKVDENQKLWNVQKLQLHFAAISKIRPKFTPIASALLGAYYRKCRSDRERDYARTTIRLLDSLNRLAEAHARLLFRDQVTIVDAIVTIRLMESTHGFGRIVRPYDVVKEELPLGPTEEEINCILEIFDMGSKQAELLTVTQEPANSRQNEISSPTQRNNSLPETQSKENTQNQKRASRTRPNIIHTSTQASTDLPMDMDMEPDELDELLSLDITMNDQNKEKPKSVNQSIPANVSDDEDQMLSQALDNIEKSQVIAPKDKSPPKSPSKPAPKSPSEPAPKVPKLDLNRPRLNLSRFAFVAPKEAAKVNSNPLNSPQASTSSVFQAPVQNPSTSRPVKNHLLCTQSDDELSQTPAASIPKLRPFRLFKSLQSQKSKQSQVLQQQNAVAKTSDGSQRENDSAYDTMSLSASVPSCQIKARTPALFGDSASVPNDATDDGDMSFLDTLEF